MKISAFFGGAVLATAILAPGGTTAIAQETYDDGLSQSYSSALAGKTIAFVPISMSFDIPQAYDAALRQFAQANGMKYVVRDPNFSVEQAVQAVNQLIDEKPDVLIVHPLDANAFDRLVRRAAAEGIYWLWVNNKGNENGDAYVGGNHYLEARLQVQMAATACKGKSGKVALIQPPPNTPSTITGTQGVTDELALHPEMTLVATQSANADPAQARSIASALMTQHPDLCAFIGLWDGEDVGIPAAVSESGKTEQVAVITTGAGSQANACDLLKNGSYSGYVSYEAATQGQLITAAVSQLLQTRPEPGSQPYGVYNRPLALTPESLATHACWSPRQ